MTPIIDRVAALGTWSLEGFYLPVLAWTVAAAAVLLLGHVLPLRRPLFRRDLLLVLLCSLPVALVARVLIPERATILSVEAPEAFDAVDVASPIEVMAAPADEPSAPALPLMAGMILLLIAGSSASALIVFMVHLRRLSRLGEVMDDSSAAFEGWARAQSIADRLALTTGTRPVRVTLSDRVAGPVTFGVERPVIAMPHALASDPAPLRLALLHELAHVRHRDAALALWHGLFQAMLVWHPLALLISRRIELHAEQACDAAVLSASGTDRRAYAEMLSGLAHGAPRLTVSMAGRPSHLRLRLRAMKASLSLHHSRAAAFCCLIALTAVLPVALRASSADAQGPELMNAGQVASQAMFRYPRRAREAGLSGTVAVRIGLGATGRVVSVRIERSDNPLFDQSALYAAPEARFQRSGPGRVEQTLLFHFNRIAGRSVVVTTPGQPLPHPAPVPPPVLQALLPAPASPASRPTQPTLTDTMNRFQRLATAAALAATIPQALPAAAQNTPASSPPTVVAVNPPLDVQPVPLTQADVVWPDIARRDSVEGRVVLNVLVGTDGRVADVQTIRTEATSAVTGERLAPGNPYEAAFSSAAAASIRQWTFRPGQKAGAAVAAWMALPVRFKTSSGALQAALSGCAVPGKVYVSGEGIFRIGPPNEPPTDANLRAATVQDRTWLECLTTRLDSSPSARADVKRHRDAAVATLRNL